MEQEIMTLTGTKVVNDKHEIQPNQYQVQQNKDGVEIVIITTTDFKFALQCFINRLL
jgi:hypothetical protein